MNNVVGAVRTNIPYNPEEIGIAERVNRTMTDGVRVVLYTENLDETYWAYATFYLSFKKAY